MIGYNNVDYNTYGGDPLNFDPSVNDEGFMGMFLLMVFGSLSASKMLSCLSTKELRLSSLMLRPRSSRSISRGGSSISRHVCGLCGGVLSL